MAAIELLTDLPFSRDERLRLDVAVPLDGEALGLVLLCGDTSWRDDGRAVLRPLQIELALAGWCAASATHRPLDGLSRLDARDVCKDLLAARDAAWEELLVRGGRTRLLLWGRGCGVGTALAMAQRSSQDGRPARAVVCDHGELPLAAGPLPEEPRRRQQFQRFLADDGAALAADRLDPAGLPPVWVLGPVPKACEAWGGLIHTEEHSDPSSAVRRLAPWLDAAEAAGDDELHSGEPRFLQR